MGYVREGFDEETVLADCFDIILQNKPATQAHDAPQFAFVSKAAKHTHRPPLAEATNYNSPRINTNIHLSRDKLIDVG